MFHQITTAKEEIAIKLEGGVKYASKINEIIDKKLKLVSDYFVKSIKNTITSKVNYNYFPRKERSDRNPT